MAETDAKDSRGVPTVDDWQAEFGRLRPDYARFTAKLEVLLRDLLRAKSIEYHLLESRTKSEASFREKVGRASKNYADPLQEICDLSGLRVITYYQDHADAVGSLIESEFVVAESDITHDAADPSAFGYKSTHYVVCLPPARSGLLEWAGFASLKAEIQVRTVLQHAWAAISHKLQYKREEDVPRTLRRKLFRLSALFEIADDEFIALRNESGVLAKSIEAKLSSGDTNIPVDSLSVSQFIAQSPLVAELSAEAAEAGFSFDASEVPDEAKTDSVSELVTLMGVAGIRTIAQLESLISSFSKHTRRYLQAQVGRSRTRWVVSPSFVCQLILVGALPGAIRVGHLLQIGWHASIAKRVLENARAFAERQKGKEPAKSAVKSRRN